MSQGGEEDGVQRRAVMDKKDEEYMDSILEEAEKWQAEKVEENEISPVLAAAADILAEEEGAPRRERIYNQLKKKGSEVLMMIKDWRDKRNDRLRSAREEREREREEREERAAEAWNDWTEMADRYDRSRS